jgi:DNA-directed RNA polymerase specialized sigma24 family protein
MLKVALDFFGSQDDAEDVAQDAIGRIAKLSEL